MPTLAASGLRSRVQISTEAGPRDSRLAFSQESVRPEVDDVFDDEDVAVQQVGVEVLQNPHHTGGLGAGAVGGDRHPIHG